MRNNLLFTILLILFCLPAPLSHPADDQNMRFVSQAGGTWRDVACEGNRLYAQHGLFLTIWDISSPASPVRLGKLQLSGCAQFIKVQGDLVYALNAFGLLQVVNVGDSTNPFIVGSLNLSFEPNAMDTAGTLIYVASDRYLRIIDAATPATPTLRGRVGLSNSAYGASSGVGVSGGVDVSGGYTYVVTSEGLRIVDVRDPDNPVLLGLYSDRYAYGGVVVRDNIAYYSGMGVFYVVDVSDPLNPKLLGSCQATSPRGGAVAVSGNYAYLGCGHGLAVVDISVPTTPTLCSYERIEGESANHIAISEGTAYVTAESYGSYFKAVDVTDPYDPAIVWDPGEAAAWTSTLAVSQNIAAVGYPSGWWFGYLRFYDVTNPAVPQLLSSLSTQLPLQMCFENKKLYLLDYGDWGDDLEILDTSNPEAPVWLESHLLSFGSFGLAASNDFVYVWMGITSGLNILDASNPTSLTLCGSYTTSFTPYEGRIVLSQDRAYTWVADVNSKVARLLVLDKTDPTSLTLLGSYDTAKNSAFDVIGDIVYLLDGGLTLKILDFADPANPVQFGSLDIGGGMIRVSNGLAYILDDEDPYDASPAVLRVVDVGNASAPVLRGSLTVWAGVSDFVAVGKFAYLAAGEAGLLIVRYTGGDSLSAKCWDLY